MDIQYNKFHDRILTAGSNGSINIYNVNSNMKLDLDVGWDKVCSGPINGALFCEDRIVTVSEDSSILGIRLDKSTDRLDVARVTLPLSITQISPMPMRFSISKCAIALQ